LGSRLSGQLVPSLSAAGPGAEEQGAVRGAPDHPRHARSGAGCGRGAARGRCAQASLHTQGRRAAAYAPAPLRNFRDQAMTRRASRTAGWGLAAAGAAIAAWAWLGASAAGPGAVTHYVLDPAKSSLEFAFDQAGAQNNGKLTLRGVTRDVRVPFTFRNATENGVTVGYMSGKTTLRRLDFGVGQGDWKATDQLGNDVGVSFALRLAAAAH